MDGRPRRYPAYGYAARKPRRAADGGAFQPVSSPSVDAILSAMMTPWTTRILPPSEVIAALRARAAPRGRVLPRDLSRGRPGRRRLRVGGRAATAIAFLLTVDRPSRFHRLLSDELWVLSGRSAARALAARAPWAARGSVLLGPGVDGAPRSATRPTARVAAHVWQAARVAPALAGAGPSLRPPHRPDWSLVTCVVTPGFEYCRLRARPPRRAGGRLAARRPAIVGELT